MNEVHKQVERIISPVYLVGGCVRDEVLGRPINDFDFTTPINPDDIEQAFKNSGRHVWSAGKRFGTIASKVQLDSGEFVKVEVTTFRSEVYTGSRKPDVQFVEHIEQDLSRRDFTINAMAKRNGKIVDPFGGMADLEASIIRAVGYPRQRFNEDPLRIMRAARFASTFMFDIEENTFNKMKERAHKLLTISKERICAEMDKILLTPFPSLGLNCLMDAGCMAYIIPELVIQYRYDQNNPHHSLDLWNHTLTVVDNVEADLNIRWAALLHDIAKPFVRDDSKQYSRYIKHDLLGAEMVERIANHLKWSSAQKKAVKELVEFHMNDDSPLKPADRIGKSL
jgi:putative nucleotidyltransferase with HDIG domain